MKNTNAKNTSLEPTSLAKQSIAEELLTSVSLDAKLRSEATDELLAAVFADKFLLAVTQDHLGSSEGRDLCAELRRFVVAGLARRGVTYADGKAVALHLSTDFNIDKIRIRALQIALEEYGAALTACCAGHDPLVDYITCSNDALAALENDARKAGALVAAANAHHRLVFVQGAEDLSYSLDDYTRG